MSCALRTVRRPAPWAVPVALVWHALVGEAAATEAPPAAAPAIEPPPAAAPATEPPPTKPNAISYKPLSILSRGLTVQYERLLAPMSVIGGTGLRLGARDDFSSVTWTTHLETRWWFIGREPWSDVPGMAGPYVGAAFDVGRTELESKSLDRSIGVAWTLEESLRVGYRFVLFGLQEITPALTAAVVHDIDQAGRLAPSTRYTFGFDLTTGWLF